MQGGSRAPLLHMPLAPLALCIIMALGVNEDNDCGGRE